MPLQWCSFCNKGAVIAVLERRQHRSVTGPFVLIVKTAARYNTLSKPLKGLRPLLNNGDFVLGTQRRIFCIFELEKFAAVHKKNFSGDLSSWLEAIRVGFHIIRQKLGPIF